MEPWWVTLLRQQQSDGFPDFAGSEVSATVRLADRLISHLIAERIPATGPIREFDLVAHRDELISIRIRLAKPAFLPPIHIQLKIERQPELPAIPTVVLKVVSQGLANLASVGLRFVHVLPPGVQYVDGQFVVDLRTILEHHGVADILNYLTDVEVTTAEHQVIVRVRGLVSAVAR